MKTFKQSTPANSAKCSVQKSFKSQDNDFLSNFFFILNGSDSFRWCGEKG